MTERERLVELIKQGDKAFADKYTGKVMSHIDEVYEFIADHLLANGVIVPPCKVGDKLYFLYNNNIFDLAVEKIVQKEAGLFLVDKKFNDWYSIDEIGKTLYLTKKEAEQALKERERE